MEGLAAVWREVVCFGGLIAVLFMAGHGLWLRCRGEPSLERALAQTWLGRGRAATCVATAVAGCLVGRVALPGGAWLGGLLFSVSGAALCALVFWLLTVDGRRPGWLLLVVFLLPAASGFVVAAGT